MRVVVLRVVRVTLVAVIVVISLAMICIVIPHNSKNLKS